MNLKKIFQIKWRKIKNCNFSDSLSSETRADGGAISFSYTMIDDLNLCESFINCSFLNNTPYSKYCIAYGGAIFYLKSYRSEASISFKSNELLQNLTFINNTSYSGNSFSCGGAIAYEVSIFYPYQKVIQNRLFECLNFINNTALSKSYFLFRF